MSREQRLPTDSPEPPRQDGGQTAAEAGSAGEPADVAARPDVYDGLDGNSLEVDALAAATDLSGRTIGQYRVEARLGGGAMAAVYRAYDEILERPVAIKLLLPGADAVMRERFRREARTVSTLDHPHIVRTIQVGQAGPDGLIYIAMELVDGVSLADILEQHGTLSPRDACLALEPIARALAYAHQQGVVHRDVKPSNILLQRAAPETPNAVQLSILPEPVIPLLSDFGIARALDAPELTSAGRTIGTPAFMAPEQCAGLADIDGRADIYSLGAVLYRCLVGRPPYGGTTTQILHAHVYDPLLIPEELARTLPLPVLELLTRSMMKEPAQRYPQVELMAQGLARCVALFADIDAPSEALDEADPTMTMAALPAARLPTAQTSRILVPAPPATPRAGIPVRPRPVIAPPPAPRQVIPPQPAMPRRQGRSNRLGALILAAALVILVVLMGVTLFSSLLDGMLPAVLSRSNETPMPGPAATVAVAPSTETGAPTPSTPPPSPTPSESQGGLAVISSPVITSAPPATPSPAPPPTVPLESAWTEAQAFFAERDWQSALDWLTIVRRIDDSFERAQVDSMLRTAYVGLVTQEIVAGRYEEALRLLDEALELLTEDPTLLSLRQATDRALSAEGEERSQARRSLQAVSADYAAALMAAGEPCAAADQAAAALQILASAELVDQQAAYRRACQEQQNREELAALGGSIIYSAQQGDLYRVLRMPVGPDSPSTVLIDDAAQPSLRPDGRVLAYYSTRPDAQGLFGFDLMAGLRATDRGIRITEYTEDARDAPASWNAAGNRLAFTSTRFGDGRYRVYLAWADGSGSESLDYGKDPVWHPSQELLVYNGVGETGNQPGLWLRRPDGSAPVRLTDNGNDQRPAWSPDGRYVVFMSNGRDDNWELYRVDVTDFSIVRLTNHLAQDGLPTVSPDGRHVAFMSDRDNYWRIWYVSIDGGEARPLGRISGELPRWLEHSIQWVR